MGQGWYSVLVQKWTILIGQFRFGATMAFTLTTPLDPARGSISRQLVHQLRYAIVSQALMPGDQLPASRRLAKELGVARGTVSAAMDDLIAEGLLETRPGAGTYVAMDAWVSNTTSLIAPSLHLTPKLSVLPDVDTEHPCEVDFRPCRPSLEAFPQQLWRRCLAAAGNQTLSADYSDPQGELVLRSTIAQYLRRSRGLSCDASNILITNGSVQAMYLVAKLFIEPGDSVLFEDPGYPLARQTFELAGANIVPACVDSDGVNPSNFPDKNVNLRLVYVTPSHQFPTGGRLSLGRRRALIQWAEQHQALILEDDYDGEFRYDVAPLAPLATLANRSVIYCGTFSKSLSPQLRLGFAVAPSKTITQLAQIRCVHEYAPNTPMQLALAKFIADGHFETHLHRTKRIYAGKRKMVVESIAQSRWAATVTGLASGLHVVVELDGNICASSLAQAAASQGVQVVPVSRYRIGETQRDNTLVLGYAEPSLTQIRQGIETLAKLSNASD